MQEPVSSARVKITVASANAVAKSTLKKTNDGMDVGGNMIKSKIHHLPPTTNNPSAYEGKQKKR